jgi:hypothetical protein
MVAKVARSGRHGQFGNDDASRRAWAVAWDSTSVTAVFNGSSRASLCRCGVEAAAECALASTMISNWWCGSQFSRLNPSIVLL